MYALITGASSGIGLECAKLLAKKGYDLILVARRTDRLVSIKKKMEQLYGCDVVVIPCDLSSQAMCIELHNKCTNLPIEVVINNAGFGKVGDFEDVPLEEELQMIDTNIKAVHILTKLFSKSMEHGNILNVASIAGYQPVPLMATYGATKSYVVSLTKAVNYEMKRKGKKVYLSALCPGPVATEFDQIANVKYSLHHITAKECAKKAIKGMFQKKSVIFPIFSTRGISVLSKLSPDSISLPIEYHLQNAKKNKI